MNRQLAAIVAVAVMAALAGYLVARQLGGPGAAPAVIEATPSSGDVVGQPRPDFSHSGTDGLPVTAADYDGRVTLVNFWATWCAPCVEEMPMLSALHDKYGPRGFSVVGIALDEPERAAAFARELGVSYPILIGQADVVVTGRRYGNATGMLPYSVLIDTAGVVRWTYLGALEAAELETRVQRLISPP